MIFCGGVSNAREMPRVSQPRTYHRGIVIWSLGPIHLAQRPLAVGIHYRAMREEGNVLAAMRPHAWKLGRGAAVLTLGVGS